MYKKFCLVVLLNIVLCVLYIMVTSWSLKIKKQEIIKGNNNNYYEQNDHISLNSIHYYYLHYKASVMNFYSHPSICIQIHNKFNGELKNGLKSSSNKDMYHSKANIINNLNAIQNRKKSIMIALDVGYVNYLYLLKTMGLIDNSKNIITYQNIYLHQIKNKLGRT
jgi:hypothetical protein